MNVFEIKCRVFYRRVGYHEEISIAVKGDAQTACAKLTKYIRANFTVEDTKGRKIRAGRVDVTSVTLVASGVLVG